MLNRKALGALVLAGCSVACSKKAEDTTAPATTHEAAQAPTAPAPAVEEDNGEREKKTAALAYATMEDGYINDANGQWAQSAKASSTFGDEDGREPSQSNVPSNLVGAPDTKTWTNNKQDMGFDWVEVKFAKAVNATEVRVVVQGGDGVEAISKIELQDEAGNWSTVWSGVSDVKEDPRGSRTWFVKSFPVTSAKVDGVKVTIANAVENGYKVFDAIQLVGK